MNSRERVLAHLDGKPVDHLPFMGITMQLAADLIGARYLDYETDFRILAEGQIRAAETFGLDYVNTMSDPAREAVDCGATAEFFEDQPAAIDDRSPLLGDKTTLVALRAPDPLAATRMQNGVQAVALLKQRVGRDLVVEGWIEGPCAEAVDLRGLTNLMLDFYDDPGFVKDLFAFCVDMELRFARAQIEAGADLIGIGDAAASLLGPALYEAYVWPYEKQLIDGIHALGARTRLHICGDTRFAAPGMGRLGCAVVDLDFLNPVSEGRAKMGPGQIILGNIDPVAVVRNGTPEGILSALTECHRAAGSRFIVGAGCEIPRDTPPENVLAMRDYARTTPP